MSHDFLFSSLRSLSTGFNFEFFVYLLGIVYLVSFDRERESRAEGEWVITTSIVRSKVCPSSVDLSLLSFIHMGVTEPQFSKGKTCILSL